MKPWHGKKRLAKKLNRSYFTKKWYREILHYLLLAQPGDLINACTGYNHRIKELDIRWRESSRGHTRIIDEIRVTDEIGEWHWFPGGGCVQLPLSRLEVIEYVRSWDTPEGWETIRKCKLIHLAERIRLLQQGTEIVDVDGVSLPLPTSRTQNAEKETKNMPDENTFDHMSASWDELFNYMTEDGIIDAAEVTLLQERIYEDGVVDREEAEFMFRINDEVSGMENDASYDALFVRVLADYVLDDETTPGEVDDGEASFLIEKIGLDGLVDDNEMELLTILCERATTELPTNLTQFILDSAKERIIADGIVDAAEVAMMRRIIFGAAGSGGSGVDRAEANFLVEINNATTDSTEHDKSWGPFFAECVGKSVLEDETSPGVIDDEEAAWLKASFEGDGIYDAQEKLALAYIRDNAADGGIPANIQLLIDILA